MPVRILDRVKIRSVSMGAKVVAEGKVGGGTSGVVAGTRFARLPITWIPVW